MKEITREILEKRINGFLKNLEISDNAYLAGAMVVGVKSPVNLRTYEGSRYVLGKWIDDGEDTFGLPTGKQILDTVPWWSSEISPTELVGYGYKNGQRPILGHFVVKNNYELRTGKKEAVEKLCSLLIDAQERALPNILDRAKKILPQTLNQSGIPRINPNDVKTYLDIVYVGDPTLWSNNGDIPILRAVCDAKTLKRLKNSETWVYKGSKS